MHGTWCFLALGLSLAAALSARAEIVKGVMSVTGGEMKWWGGLVRDTIARQSDVDESSVKYEVEPGEGKYREAKITFHAKKGKSIDLEKIHADINATRLSGKTRSAVNFLEITATGEVVGADKDVLLNVAGTKQHFILADDPKAKPKEGAKSPFQRLRETLAKGEKVTSVTGRVHGWSGPWPEVLKALPGEPARGAKDSDKPAATKKLPLLIVTDFETAKR